MVYNNNQNKEKIAAKLCDFWWDHRFTRSPLRPLFVRVNLQFSYEQKKLFVHPHALQIKSNWHQKWTEKNRGNPSDEHFANTLHIKEGNRVWIIFFLSVEFVGVWEKWFETVHIPRWNFRFGHNSLCAWVLAFKNTPKRSEKTQ